MWRKSSYSEASGNACVEIAETGTVIVVRDSKYPELPWVAVGYEAWMGFSGALRAGKLQRER
jgi:hypothetical protein